MRVRTRSNSRPRRRMLLDLAPLRASPAFARLWAGTSASALGGQLSSYAILLQSWQLTHSPAAVGGTGLAAGAPRILFALFGGALSDHTDRRRLILLTGSGLIGGSLALTAQSALGWHAVWVLYVVAAVKALLSAVSGPARATLVPALLDRAQVPAGVALNQMSSQWSVLCGPMLAGALVGWCGLTGCYLIDSLSYVASLYGVYRLPRLASAHRGRPGRAAMLQGLGYLTRHPVIRGCLLADLSATVLAYPVALLPELTSDRFGGSAAILGCLMSALALGGLLASLLSRRVTRLPRVGLLVLVAAGVWAAAIALVGLCRPVWMVLGLLLVAGAADTISVIGRGIVVQLATDEAYLGRVNAVSQAVGVAGPALGNFRAGLLGSAVGAEAGVALGGVASICALALIGRLVPAMRAGLTHAPHAAGRSDAAPDGGPPPQGCLVIAVRSGNGPERRAAKAAELPHMRYLRALRQRRQRG